MGIISAFSTVICRKRLPALCKEIIKFNPGSRVVLQVDSEERFYRVFVMLKSSMDTVSKGCITCIEVDGTFHKHPSFNGVTLVALGKTGDMKNVPLAIAIPCSKKYMLEVWK